MSELKEITPGSAAPRRLPRVAFRTFRATAIVLALALPCTVPAQRAELERRIQRTMLPNGLEVIVVPNRGVPLVTIEADVKNGSFTQPPEYEGLSHLYEHMFFKANKQYPDPDAFLARASELGAVFNGTTSEERVNYFLTVPADSAEGGMRFLAAALIDPLFRQDELEREREVVIGEYDRNESNPYFPFSTAMNKALWTTAWSRKNPLGERAVIQSTTTAKMQTIQRRYYVPNNTAIIITGDIAADRAFNLAHGVFGGWKRGADPFATAPIPPIPPLVRDTAIIVEQPIGTAIVELQWQGPSAVADAPTTYAADVLSDVLNAPGSRFQKRLVDSGLFESIGIGYYTLNHVGPITVEGATAPGKLKQALGALKDELKKLGDPSYYTPQELATVKQRRLVNTQLNLERASGFAQQVGFWWAVTGMDYFLGYADNMAKQTPANLQAYATKYILGKPHVIGVMLSPDARRALNLTPAQLLDSGARP